MSDAVYLVVAVFWSGDDRTRWFMGMELVGWLTVVGTAAVDLDLGIPGGSITTGLPRAVAEADGFDSVQAVEGAAAVGTGMVMSLASPVVFPGEPFASPADSGEKTFSGAEHGTVLGTEVNEELASTRGGT